MLYFIFLIHRSGCGHLVAPSKTERTTMCNSRHRAVHRRPAAAAAAAAAVALLRCPHHRCLHPRAAALLPPPQPPRCCHCAAAVMLCTAAALPSSPRRCQADADAALSRCRHRRCHRRCTAVRWFVVAFLSVVRFCHCMPSCNRLRSRCRTLLRIIV